MSFFAAIIVPVLRKPENRASLGTVISDIGARYRVLGWASLAVLMISGIANLSFRGIDLQTLSEQDFWRAPVGLALRHKLELLFVVLVLLHAQERIVGRKAMAEM